MIVNLLRIRFKDGVSVEEQEEVLAVMRRTAGLEMVAFGAVGKDFGNPADGFTHSYLAALPDLEALERYMHDPVHLSGDDVIMDKLEKLSAVRFTDDSDPDLGKAVYGIAARKMEMYPEWAKRIDEIFGANV
ncbi:Dabb family protein [Kribbella kalugense]|uniref:Stress responsive alpha/beta barrel protein n=1 Tax=Kribbella kalugense TaxID=2512221 RepID=A0A4R7ZL80_9ACTN|nr:Dabb family protein [Kribbella kalugense]TDW15930.1 stress responsive alpha/beta barrel protein [Kribbella kalugense]